jgi:hypothetical protein
MYERARVDPGESGVLLSLVSLSPDERFVLVGARMHRPYYATSSWVVDLTTADVVVLPGVEHSPRVPTGWNADGTLSLEFRPLRLFPTPAYEPRHPHDPRYRVDAIFDARSGQVVRIDDRRGMTPAEWHALEPRYERELVRRDGWTDVVNAATSRVERSIRVGRFESVSFPAARRSDRLALHSTRSETTVIDLLDGSERALDPAVIGGSEACVAFLRDGRTLFVGARHSLCLRELDGSIRVLVEGTYVTPPWTR